VTVQNPVDGEFVADLVTVSESGRTILQPAIGYRGAKAERFIEMTGTAPIPAGLESARFSAAALAVHRRVHIPCATAIAMQSLRTWGASHARL